MKLKSIRRTNCVCSRRQRTDPATSGHSIPAPGVNAWLVTPNVPRKCVRSLASTPFTSQANAVRCVQVRYCFCLVEEPNTFPFHNILIGVDVLWQMIRSSASCSRSPTLSFCWWWYSSALWWSSALPSTGATASSRSTCAISAARHPSTSTSTYRIVRMIRPPRRQ